MWKETPIRKGGSVEFVSNIKTPSGKNIEGLGTVLSIDGDKVTVDCIYSGRIVVDKESCWGVVGGY